MTWLIGIAIFISVGTAIALAFLSGAHTANTPYETLPPILRITPREQRSELDRGAS